MPLKSKAGQFSIRFKTKKAAMESGTFKGLTKMGKKPRVVKGGMSKEEKKIRKDFPKTRSPSKQFPFRIVSTNTKKKRKR